MEEKKLYKSNTNKKLCGVCGGIAEYFAIDPTIIRLLWALAVIIPELSITCRRLHDGGFSGGWTWLYCLPVLGEITLLVMCALHTRDDRWKEKWFPASV